MHESKQTPNPLKSQLQREAIAKPEKLDKNEKCEVYLSFNKDEYKSLDSYCNTIQTPDGGYLIAGYYYCCL